MGNNNSNPLDSGVSNFIKVIREYLDNRAANDTEFAAKYANPKKSVEACCAFIVQQIQKANVQCAADEEVYGLAVHYYDEDDIPVDFAPLAGAKIVSNKMMPLTDAEKAVLHEQAEREYVEEQKRAMEKAKADAEAKAKKAIKDKAAKEAEKAKEEAERVKAFEARQQSLFDFNDEEA